MSEEKSRNIIYPRTCSSVPHGIHVPQGIRVPQVEKCKVNTMKNIQYRCLVEDSCVSLGTPPALGTPCGTHRWCLNGQCIPMAISEAAERMKVDFSPLF